LSGPQLIFNHKPTDVFPAHVERHILFGRFNFGLGCACFPPFYGFFDGRRPPPHSARHDPWFNSHRAMEYDRRWKNDGQGRTPNFGDDLYKVRNRFDPGSFGTFVFGSMTLTPIIFQLANERVLPLKPLLFKGGVGVVSCRLSLRERCLHIATTPTPPLKRRG